MVTRVGYMVLSFKKYLMRDMPPFPTTLWVEWRYHKTERAAVPEDRRRPTVTPTGISQHFGRCEMGSNFVIMLI